MSTRTQLQSIKSQSTTAACVSGCQHHDDDPSIHTSSNLIKNTGKEIVFVDELSDLKKIMDDDSQMVLCRQPKPTTKFIKKLSNASILPEHLPSFEGMVPALPGLVSEVLKKVCLYVCVLSCALSFSQRLISHHVNLRYIHVPYPIRSRPRVLSEDETDELVEHIDKIVQVFTDIASESGFIRK